MKKNTYGAGRWFMSAGLLCLLAAFCLTGYNILEEQNAEQQAANALQALEYQMPDSADTIPAWLLAPEMEMPLIQVDNHAYIGTLEFPALGLQLPVISEWNDVNLKVAPCRYSGSAYLDNLILAGHNYKKQFGVLKYLQPGDRVVFIDNDSNRFCYQVSETEILSGTAVEEMQEGEWDFTMFTCTADSQNRMTVRCQKQIE